VGLCALPAAALASSASVQARGVVLTVVYTAAPNEVNTVKVDRGESGRYVFEDTGPTITPVATAPLPNTGCQADPSDPHRVTCDGTGVQRVSITLNDLNDDLTVTDSASPQPLDRSALQAEGGLGNDTLRGGSASETLQGSPGDDTLIGGGGDDTLQGFDGADAMDGGEGTDEITGSAGDDTLLGGAGDDGRLSGGDGHDVVDGGEGNDDVRGDDGPDTVLGGRGDDRLDVDTDLRADAADGPDALDGGPGADILGAGRPREASPGGTPSGQDADTLNGGDGIDTADYSQRTEPLTIDLDGDADDGESGEADNVEPDVERVIGGSNADMLIGSSAANFLDGRDGEDTIDGLGGDDALLGGVNDPSGDNLSGGSGSDTLSGGPGDDALVGGAGDDGALGGGGGDRVEGEAGNDTLSGGAGADTVDGGDGDDLLSGGDVVLVGGDGPDELIGGRGADVLLGGRGNDRLDGGPGPDYISGESERDTVTYEDRASKVVVTLDGQNNDGEAGENDNVLPDVEVILGGLEGDDLSGDADVNTVNGGSGEDFIDGDLDPDRLLGGDAPDIVWARDGVADEVACGEGGDLVIADVRDKLIECETIDRPGARRLIVGRYARVHPRGEFRLRLPQGRRFFPLKDEVKIPIGSTIDPEAGVVRLTTALNRTGARQVASVSTGRFTVRQKRGRGTVTTLRLAGKLPDCPRSSTRRGKAKEAARPSARKLRVNVKNRRARTKTRRANYRVRGRYSIGGSYGTAWTTEDRCDGTLTTVLSGTVRVRDFGRGRTVTVRQGHRYLAAR
jgi:Ca2+-binding RTX toxin-like protein